MARIAFVTCRSWPEIAGDDRPVAELLAASGIEVIAAPWNAGDADWSAFDRVVIRSAWDYHYPENFGGYVSWLRSFEGQDSRLWNPPATVLGNLDKAYLAVLADRGASVVPTIYAATGDDASLRELIRSRGWDRVVIKPAVSASAVGVWRSSLATAAADQERFGHETGRRTMLVQPYMEEIVAGEWSLVFIDGEYSHAAIKIPSDGLRVQRSHGGRAEAREPDAGLIAQARAILELSGGETLYARVDGIDSGGRFVLMELELNEPALFFLGRDDAVRRCGDAIVRTLG